MSGQATLQKGWSTGGGSDGILPARLKTPMVRERSVGSGELLQETDVVFEEGPQVSDLPFEHGDALHAKPKSETAVDLRVVVYHFKHFGIDHA